MEGNNKIIERIIKDAQDKCDEIALKAQTQKEKLLSSNELHILRLQEKQESECLEQGKAMVANAIANAKLDLKKLRLQYKRELLDEVYEKAYQHVLSLPANEYLALIERVLKAHSAKGEAVDIAQRDVKLITQQYLDKLNLGLKLNDVCKIEGGVILHSKGYSKNLSLKSLFEVIRQNSEIEIAQILFNMS